MSPAFYLRSVLFVIIVFGLSFAGAVLRGDEIKDPQTERNGGYFLLHEVSSNEKQLGLLLIVKTAPPEIGAYVKRVTRVAGDSLDELDEMQARDPRIKFDPNPLPQIELDVRASIKDQKQHELLFGTTGPTFVRALLLSQLEASNYAANLAKVLGEQETSPSRAKALQKISDRWTKLREEAFRLLGD